MVYTNGSVNKSRVRVVVVARDRHKHLYVGLESQSIVYVAEL